MDTSSMGKLDRILAKNVNELMKSSRDLNSNPKLASRARLGLGTIQRIRNAETSARVITIEALADAFGVNPTRLLEDVTAQAKSSRIEEENVSPYARSLIERLRHAETAGSSSPALLHAIESILDVALNDRQQKEQSSDDYARLRNAINEEGHDATSDRKGP